MIKSKRQNKMVEKYFDKCEKGRIGVMPYMEGGNKIKFVWNDKVGRGRIIDCTLSKEGKEYAWKRYCELKEKWKRYDKKQEAKDGD